MRRTKVLALVALLALVASGCSGGDGQGNRFQDDAGDATLDSVDVTLVRPDGEADAPGDGQGGDEAVDAADGSGPDACAPGCGARECGTVCGEACGTCGEGTACNADGHCVSTCQAACDGRQCGDDGCNGSCGTCGGDQICTDLGHCAPAPTCTVVTKIGCCEADVLWACEDGVVVPTACPAAGGCGWVDGDGAYGCGGGGLAGPHGTFPLDCPWVCHPLCVGQECGDDGCGGSCGACPQGSTCDFAGACCEPTCTTADGSAKHCGSDGCGGSCGACGLGEVCAQDGTCQSPCANACEGRACGLDGCGGVCGLCGPGLTCTDAGACVEHCTPGCQGKVCGGDGCGGTCGACPAGTFCDAHGACGTTCAPKCLGKQCGADGCGGTCGDCAGDLLCTLEQACGSSCLDCGFSPECLAFGFESGNLLGWSAIAEPLVLSTFGATSAPQGTFMLDLDTAGEGGDNDGATIQTCVPDGALTLHFLWRLYSEEFKEFCGTQYQDFFRVTVGYGDGHAVVFQRTIDELCPKGSCLACGAYEAPLLVSDVGFDQGEAWMTPWQAANVSLAAVLPSGGGVISLTFEAGDEGDSIYDTHILVDEIRLVQACAAQCAGAAGVAKQCGDDGCGGQCGVCPVGHPCGADGTCGGCEPACAGKQCGPDGCGGSCGACGPAQSCVDATCVACQPQCTSGAVTKQCGADGCGGSCGTCPDGTTCQADFTCAAAPEGLGAPCETAADCGADMYCLASSGGFPPGGDLICTIACEFTTPGGGSGGCPAGWSCFPNLLGGSGPTAYCVEGGGFPG